MLLLLACATHALRALPPDATVRMPEDDGPHDQAQTEWWHVHAELRDLASGEPLRLFAGFVVQRTDLDRVALLPVPVGVNPFHAAYVRMASPGYERVADRESFPDVFSAGFRGAGLDLHHGDWRLRRDGGALLIRVGAEGARTELRLRPTRAPTRPGQEGRVELSPGARQLWVQEERMEVDGVWTEGGRTRLVTGTAFAKHQWGRIYDPGLDGFLWLSADLPDGRSLSVAWLQDGAQSGVPGSLAWTSAPDGQVEAIDPRALRVRATGHWRSPRSGARWPVAWTVQGAGLDLRVEAERPDQELWVFPTSLWAGPTRVIGSVDGAPVDLVGFAEQAGADRPALRALFRSDPPPGYVAEAAPPAPVVTDTALVPWSLSLGSEVEE